MKNKGITLVALTITIIILLIIAGISISAGGNMIKKANLEALKTNMLLIKSKGKEYVENANFKLGIKQDEKESKIDVAKLELKGRELDLGEKNNFESNGIINTAGDTVFCLYYDLTTNEDNNYLEEMGIKGLELEKNEKYIIKYNIDTMNVEVYNTLGYKDGNNFKYSLTDIEKIEE